MIEMDIHQILSFNYYKRFRSVNSGWVVDQ